jgi:hypothetical protein
MREQGNKKHKNHGDNGCSAQLLHGDVKARIEIDENVFTPQKTLQVAAGDHFSGVIQECNEQLPKLTFQPDANAKLPQFASGVVGFVRTAAVEQGWAC